MCFSTHSHRGKPSQLSHSCSESRHHCKLISADQSQQSHPTAEREMCSPSVAGIAVAFLTHQWCIPPPWNSAAQHREELRTWESSFYGTKYPNSPLPASPNPLYTTQKATRASKQQLLQEDFLPQCSYRWFLNKESETLYQPHSKTPKGEEQSLPSLLELTLWISVSTFSINSVPLPCSSPRYLLALEILRVWVKFDLHFRFYIT